LPSEELIQLKYTIATHGPKKLIATSVVKVLTALAAPAAMAVHRRLLTPPEWSQDYCDIAV